MRCAHRALAQPAAAAGQLAAGEDVGGDGEVREAPASPGRPCRCRARARRAGCEIEALRRPAGSRRGRRVTIPARIFSSVDLPAPFSPTSACASPAATRNDDAAQRPHGAERLVDVAELEAWHLMDRCSNAASTRRTRAAPIPLRRAGCVRRCADVSAHSSSLSESPGPDDRAPRNSRRLRPRRIVDERVHPAVGEVVEVLEHLVVRRRDREVQIRHRPDRAADIVRREQQVVGLRPAGQPLHRQEAAEVRQIDLDDVDEAVLDERADILDRVRALAGRDRQPCRLRTRRVASGFSGGIGSSIHSGPNASSGRRHAHGSRRRETAVHLDHDLDVGTNRVAHRARRCRHRPAFFVRR